MPTTPDAWPRRSSAASPSWPTRPPPTGGRPAGGRLSVRPRASRAPTPQGGAGPGRSASEIPSAGAPGGGGPTSVEVFEGAEDGAGLDPASAGVAELLVGRADLRAE